MINKLLTTLAVVTIMMLNGCVVGSTDMVVNGNIYQSCELSSFESDYDTEPQENDNAYVVLDGTTYYGYCG